MNVLHEQCGGLDFHKDPGMACRRVVEGATEGREGWKKAMTDVVRSDTSLVIDLDLLTRAARVAERHHHALLEAIRMEFGDEPR
jgi:hypothetical protein